MQSWKTRDTRSAIEVTETILHGNAACCEEWIEALARLQALPGRRTSRRDIAALRPANACARQAPLTALGDLGYTCDWLSPQQLADEEATVAEGILLPGGPGYRALVIDRVAVSYESAAQILQYARRGLPVVFVNGGAESQRGNAVVSLIKVLPNVVEIGDPASIASTLAGLGVQPRVGFLRPSGRIQTQLRQDGDRRYLLVSHCVHSDEKALRTTIRMEGTGVPYAVDLRSGASEPLGTYRIKNKTTEFPVVLRPGEVAFYVLATNEEPGLHALYSDGEIVIRGGQLFLRAARSGIYSVELSDGREVELRADCRAAIPLTGWGLVAADTCDSGTGAYEASFLLPDDWDEGDGAILKTSAALGYAAAVFVNGQKTGFCGALRRAVDITPFVSRGSNHIRVEVLGPLADGPVKPQLHGMLDSTEIRTYKQLPL